MTPTTIRLISRVQSSRPLGRDLPLRRRLSRGSDTFAGSRMIASRIQKTVGPEPERSEGPGADATAPAH